MNYQAHLLFRDDSPPRLGDSKIPLKTLRIGNRFDRLKLYFAKIKINTDGRANPNECSSML